MITFDSHEKRTIALRLVASGAWTSARWASLSQIVHNECIGLLPDGTLVTRERPQRQARQYLSLTEAAGLAGVHPATIRRWVKDGKLIPSPDARPVAIGRDDLERFLQSHRPQ